MELASASVETQAGGSDLLIEASPHFLHLQSLAIGMLMDGPQPSIKLMANRHPLSSIQSQLVLGFLGCVKSVGVNS